MIALKNMEELLETLLEIDEVVNRKPKVESKFI